MHMTLIIARDYMIDKKAQNIIILNSKHPKPYNKSFSIHLGSHPDRAK